MNSTLSVVDESLVCPQLHIFIYFVIQNSFYSVRKWRQIRKPPVYEKVAK